MKIFGSSKRKVSREVEYKVGAVSVEQAVEQESHQTALPYALPDEEPAGHLQPHLHVHSGLPHL